MHKRSYLFWSGGFIFFVFLIFSYIVSQRNLVSFDYQSTEWLQQHISMRWDTFFSIFSVLGTIDATLIFLAIFLIVYRNRKSIYVIISFAIILCFELFSKYVINHPAPPRLFARYKVLVNYPSSYLPQPPSSYPSGHAARTVFLSGLIIFFIVRTKKIPFWLKTALVLFIVIYDVTMLITRVDLGEHWTSDVIGGCLLGFSLILFNLCLIDASKKKRS